jgi:hypothetical protein
MERSVAVEGKFLGREYDEFHLNNLTEPMLGSDAFTEVYFRTSSGNQYAICRMKNQFEQPTREWFLINARNSKAVILAEETIEFGVLEVGMSFFYHNNSIRGNTSDISEIICVNTQKEYAPDYLKKITDGNTSNVRQDFRLKATSKTN